MGLCSEEMLISPRCPPALFSADSPSVGQALAQLLPLKLEIAPRTARAAGLARGEGAARKRNCLLLSFLAISKQQQGGFGLAAITHSPADVRAESALPKEAQLS